MTGRAISAPMDTGIRESRRVATVASALDMDEFQVRALIDAGELEAHGIGKRGIRVYLDSVRDYQERNVKAAKAQRSQRIATARHRRQTGNASHQTAMAELRRHGVVP